MDKVVSGEAHSIFQSATETQHCKCIPGGLQWTGVQWAMAACRCLALPVPGHSRAGNNPRPASAQHRQPCFAATLSLSPTLPAVLQARLGWSLLTTWTSELSLRSE